MIYNNGISVGSQSYTAREHGTPQTYHRSLGTLSSDTGHYIDDYGYYIDTNFVGMSST